MPKSDYLYAISELGEINETLYTNLRGVSKDIKISERTLWRWFSDYGEYRKGNYVIKRCRVQRIRGRGNF